MGQIVVRILFMAMGFLIAFMISFAVLAVKLYKSNNLGNGELSGNSTIDFIIVPTNDFKLSERIYNPVIEKHMDQNAVTYSDSSKPKSIEDEIDSMDLSNISWHK